MRTPKNFWSDEKDFRKRKEDESWLRWVERSLTAAAPLFGLTAGAVRAAAWKVRESPALDMLQAVREEGVALPGNFWASRLKPMKWDTANGAFQGSDVYRDFVARLDTEQRTSGMMIFRVSMDEAWIVHNTAEYRLCSKSRQVIPSNARGYHSMSYGPLSVFRADNGERD